MNLATIKDILPMRKGVHMKKFIAWFRDPFFWELIEAQHSPDSRAMNMLFEKYE